MQARRCVDNSAYLGSLHWRATTDKEVLMASTPMNDVANIDFGRVVARL
jgi:hypothetical protein